MVGDESYRTIRTRGRAEFDVHGSTFICHASPARTVARAEGFIEEIGAQYEEATHNVPAYRVREGDLMREWSSDVGEPTGSAGKPTLSVLAKRDLQNVAVVVTRYFGGTELGIGGLARAYSRGTNEAVDAAGVVTRRPQERIDVAVSYDDSGTVRGILESRGVEFDAEYAEQAMFEVWVPTVDADELRDSLRSATSGRVEIDGH